MLEIICKLLLAEKMCFFLSQKKEKNINYGNQKFQKKNVKKWEGTLMLKYLFKI